MPLYEYECESCGVRFERIQKFSDPPPAACPTCGGPIRKLLSSPAIRFKGSGFYINDYGRKGASTDKADSPSAGESKTETSKTSESKAASSDGKDSGTKDSGSKDGGTKDGGSKDSGSKDSAAKDASASKAPSTSAPTKST
jgi:putative FmdB family regulatory protein